MTLEQLINLARTRLRDKLLPYLWDDSDLTEFANSAVTEACARARLLQTSVTLPVVAGIETYTIPYTVLKPLGAMFLDHAGITVNAGTFVVGRWYIVGTPGTTVYTTVGAANSTAGTLFRATGVGSGTGTATLCNETSLIPIGQTDYFSLRAFSHQTSGRPMYYIRGDAANTVLLYPTPNLAGHMILDVARMPTEGEEMTEGDSVPVIPAEFHRDLVYWMLAEAYLIDNSDTKSSKNSMENAAKFEAKFGRRITARGEAMGRKYIVGSNMRNHSFGGDNNSIYH